MTSSPTSAFRRGPIAIVGAVKDSGGATIPALNAKPRTAPAGHAAQSAFSTATRWSAFSAAGFLVLGLAASMSLGPSRHPGDDTAGRPGDGDSAAAEHRAASD